MGVVIIRKVAGVALGDCRDYLAQLRVILPEYIIGELPNCVMTRQLVVRGVALIDYIIVAPVPACRGVDFIRIEAAQALGNFQRAVNGKQPGQIVALVAARGHAHADELSVRVVDLFEENAVAEGYRVVYGVGDMIRARYIALNVAKNYLRHRVALRPVILIDGAELGVNKARRAEIGDVEPALPAALEIAL